MSTEAASVEAGTPEEGATSANNGVTFEKFLTAWSRQRLQHLGANIQHAKNQPRADDQTASLSRAIRSAHIHDSWTQRDAILLVEKLVEQDVMGDNRYQDLPRHLADLAKALREDIKESTPSIATYDATKKLLEEDLLLQESFPELLSLFVKNSADTASDLRMRAPFSSSDLVDKKLEEIENDLLSFKKQPSLSWYGDLCKNTALVFSGLAAIAGNEAVLAPGAAEHKNTISHTRTLLDARKELLAGLNISLSSTDTRTTIDAVRKILELKVEEEPLVKGEPREQLGACVELMETLATSQRALGEHRAFSVAGMLILLAIAATANQVSKRLKFSEEIDQAIIPAYKEAVFELLDAMALNIELLLQAHKEQLPQQSQMGGGGKA